MTKEQQVAYDKAQADIATTSATLKGAADRYAIAAFRVCDDAEMQQHEARYQNACNTHAAAIKRAVAVLRAAGISIPQ
jgi:hypothetical protein